MGDEGNDALKILTGEPSSQRGVRLGNLEYHEATARCEHAQVVSKRRFEALHVAKPIPHAQEVETATHDGEGFAEASNDSLPDLTRFPGHSRRRVDPDHQT